MGGQLLEELRIKAVERHQKRVAEAKEIADAAVAAAADAEAKENKAAIRATEAVKRAEEFKAKAEEYEKNAAKRIKKADEEDAKAVARRRAQRLKQQRMDDEEDWLLDKIKTIDTCNDEKTCNFTSDNPTSERGESSNQRRSQESNRRRERAGSQEQEQRQEQRQDRRQYQRQERESGRSQADSGNKDDDSRYESRPAKEADDDDDDDGTRENDGEQKAEEDDGNTTVQFDNTHNGRGIRRAIFAAAVRGTVGHGDVSDRDVVKIIRMRYNPDNNKTPLSIQNIDVIINKIIKEPLDRLGVIWVNNMIEPFTTKYKQTFYSKSNTSTNQMRHVNIFMKYMYVLLNPEKENRKWLTKVSMIPNMIKNSRKANNKGSIFYEIAVKYKLFDQFYVLYQQIPEILKGPNTVQYKNDFYEKVANEWNTRGL